ncbi:hypothetical protein Mapa_001079 [Marchantia paleacea]|nr:hypothetical protein Mapa_001079 [Marchantia paleacea]
MLGDRRSKGENRFRWVEYHHHREESLRRMGEIHHRKGESHHHREENRHRREEILHRREGNHHHKEENHHHKEENHHRMGESHRRKEESHHRKGENLLQGEFQQEEEHRSKVGNREDIQEQGRVVASLRRWEECSLLRVQGTSPSSRAA